MEDERTWAVKRLLFEYVKSPSLRHMRDGHSLHRLALEIVTSIDRANGIWRKWDGQRETLLKSAAGCWIPAEDLRSFLNEMPGPPLTLTDVVQRLKALEDENYDFPNADLQPGCLALYLKEKAEGTELPAIIGALRDYCEHEEERLHIEQQAERQQRQQEQRLAQEQRLLSGADCRWTQMQKSVYWYCRINGRTYRLSPTKDKKWNLHRVTVVNDDELGVLVGTYRGRGDATKVLKEVAYQAESRWS